MTFHLLQKGRIDMVVRATAMDILRTAETKDAYILLTHPMEKLVYASISAACAKHGINMPSLSKSSAIAHSSLISLLHESTS
jgi:hypothetical protein